MSGSLPVFCDEVLVDKAEVPGPPGEKLPCQIQQQRVIERGFNPFLWPQKHVLISSRSCSTSCLALNTFNFHLFSISSDLLPPPACWPPWYHLHSSPSSVRLQTEMTFVSSGQLTSVVSYSWIHGIKTFFNLPPSLPDAESCLNLLLFLQQQQKAAEIHNFIPFSFWISSKQRVKQIVRFFEVFGDYLMFAK